MYNTKHSDGSINIDSERNVIVSPYDQQFYYQIEDGVRSAVQILIDKGYLTIASCAGHNVRGASQVTVAVNSEQVAYKLIQDLKEIGIDAVMDYSFGHFSINTVNSMFLRTYIEFHCVKILLYHPSVITYPFKQLIVNHNTKKLKNIYEYIY